MFRSEMSARCVPSTDGIRTCRCNPHGGMPLGFYWCVGSPRPATHVRSRVGHKVATMMPCSRAFYWVVTCEEAYHLDGRADFLAWGPLAGPSHGYLSARSSAALLGELRRLSRQNRSGIQPATRLNHLQPPFISTLDVVFPSSCSQPINCQTPIHRIARIPACPAEYNTHRLSEGS